MRWITIWRVLAIWLVLTTTPAQGASSPLVGQWHGQHNGATVVVHFRADGNGSYNGSPMQYQILGRQLVVAIGGDVNAYNYQVKGSVLTVSGGNLAAPLNLKRGTAPANAAARGAG